MCGTRDLPCSIPESWYVDTLRTEIAFYRERACCDPGNKRGHTQACLDNVALLRQIMNDLPSNRDWLDPDLERMARSAIEERKGMIENDWIKEHVLRHNPGKREKSDESNRSGVPVAQEAGCEPVTFPPAEAQVSGEAV